MERRQFLKVGAIGLGLTTGELLWQVAPAQAATHPATIPDADTALQLLMEGNQRFVTQQPQHPHQAAARLKEVAQVQHPFATILSCADSRVAPELLFDQGIGDIFDVRVAGNIATPVTIGSIEYAVAHLGSTLVMVLGHERCGAVTATVKGESGSVNVNSFIEGIKPAIKGIRGKSDGAIDQAVIANVNYQIEVLKKSPVIIERLLTGGLKIVGARYDLDTGKVTMV